MPETENTTFYTPLQDEKNLPAIGYMKDRKSQLYLIMIMTLVVLFAGAVGIYVLYRAAFEQERGRLAETVLGHTRVIEMLAEIGAAAGETEVHQNEILEHLAQRRYFQNLALSHELIFARLEGNNLVNLFVDGPNGLEKLNPLPFDTTFTMPVREALLGHAGSLTGIDRHGRHVLAVYAPVKGLNWGIAAQIELASIRAPFVNASLIAAVAAFLAILIGSAFFFRVTDPLIRRMLDSEMRTRIMVETAVDGIITIDDTGIVQSFNPAAERIFGYTASDVIGKNVDLLMPPPYHEEHNAYLANYVESGVKRIIGIGRELEGRKSDGTIFPMHLSVSEFAINGQRRFTGIVQDISARVMAEQSLQASEARIRAIVETAVDAIITIDDRGIINSLNSAVLKLFGYSPDEVIGKNVKVLMPAPYQAEHDTYIKNYLHTGDKKMIGIGRETVAQRKDGSTFPIQLSVSEFFLGEQRMFAGIIHDITKQHSLQQEILHSERLAVIGRMAAKVAHEVRNPLSSISLNAELLEEEVDGLEGSDTDEAKSLLRSMITEIERVTSLTDEYLQFSRLPESRPVPGDLNVFIRELLDLMQQELRQKKIEVQQEGLTEQLTLRFDRAQLRRVLINIFRNAVEAMPKGGILSIQTVRSETVVVIGIRDTGVGIPKELVQEIFSPFFTTKDFGTGLGLAISQQVITEHQGSIICESNEGEGTTFRIELPLV